MSKKKEKKEKKKAAAIAKRELKEQKKQEKKQKKTTEFKPKNNAGKTFVVILLWTVILFFSVKGIAMTITAEDSESVKDTMTTHMDTLSESKNAELGAGTFAKNFVYDYFTYTVEGEENWLARMNSYTADGVTFEAPRGANSQKVISSEIKKIDMKGKGKTDIDISARIEFTIETTAEGEKHLTTQSNVYTVRVPVTEKGGHFAVESTPIFVADTNISKRVEVPSGLDGDVVSMEDSDRIEKLLNSFFAAYYGGNASDLKYYTTREFGSNATVHGTIRFVSVNNCYAVEKGQGFRAKADVIITDGAVEFTQKCVLDIVQGAENRLYVSGISTR